MLPALWSGSPVSRHEGTPVNRLSSVFDRLFDDVFAPISTTMRSTLPLSMWEDENHLFLEIDAPGVTEKDVEIAVEGGELVIRGERKSARKEGGYDTRAYGRFEQRIGLNAPVDVDRVEATLANGVLSVTLPKSEEAKPRKIAVKSA